MESRDRDAFPVTLWLLAVEERFVWTQKNPDSAYCTFDIQVNHKSYRIYISSTTQAGLEACAALI